MVEGSTGGPIGGTCKTSSALNSHNVGMATNLVGTVGGTIGHTGSDVSAHNRHNTGKAIGGVTLGDDHSESISCLGEEESFLTTDRHHSEGVGLGMSVKVSLVLDPAIITNEKSPIDLNNGEDPFRDGKVNSVGDRPLALIPDSSLAAEAFSDDDLMVTEITVKGESYT